MALLNDAMLTQLRKTQESSMMHTCLIEPYIVAGDGTVSYGAAFETPCGFQLTSGGFDGGSLYESATATAKLRLPIGTPIGMKDRVTILTAFGRELEPPQIYQVSGLPGSAGPSGQLVALQEVYL